MPGEHRRLLFSRSIEHTPRVTSFWPLRPGAPPSRRGEWLDGSIKVAEAPRTSRGVEIGVELAENDAFCNGFPSRRNRWRIGAFRPRGAGASA